jgi:hypothetical protein
MPLHPISVVNHVLGGYRSYLRTEFGARDPKLRTAVEESIETRHVLAEGTSLPAHLPSAPASALAAGASLFRTE